MYEREKDLGRNIYIYMYNTHTAEFTSQDTGIISFPTKIMNKRVGRGKK